MRFLTLFLLIFLFSGCSLSNSKMGEFLQTDGAKLVQRDYKEIISLLQEFKKKLDVRNPQAFHKQQDYSLYKEMKDGTSSLFYSYEGKYLKGYDEYLRVAFSDSHVKLRNDFLILGLYKLIYETYKQEEGHKFTNLGYDAKKFQKLYYYLKVINWKLKTKKDSNGNYLFLTWQRNWQVELDRNPQKSLYELSYIKSGKESLLDPSNFSFEVMMNQMFFHVKNSAKIIGEEPLELSIDAMTSLVFFL